MGAVRHSPGRTLETTNAAFDPTREETDRFVAGLLGEMAGLFPDRAMHAAGDEVSSVHWLQDPAIRACMAEHGIATTADAGSIHAPRRRDPAWARQEAARPGSGHFAAWGLLILLGPLTGCWESDKETFHRGRLPLP